PDHRATDDVGRASLDRCVDRGALEESAFGLGAGLRKPIVALAAEQGADEPSFARLRLGGLHVVPYAGEALEVARDVLAGFLARDAELIGKSEGRDAVDDAEVDRLCAAADHRVHALDGHPE